MIDIKKLTAGQVVYEIKRNKYAAFQSNKWNHWPVYIREVDLENDKVLASWNGNPPIQYSAKNGKFSWFKDKKR